MRRVLDVRAVGAAQAQWLTGLQAPDPGESRQWYLLVLHHPLMAQNAS